MAKVAHRPYKQERGALLQALKRLIITPVTGLYLVFAFTAERLVKGIFYLSFKSLLFDPNGILLWTIFSAGSIAGCYVLARGVFTMIKQRAPMKEARQRYDAYEPGADLEMIAVQRLVLKRITMAPFLVAFMLYLFLLPLPMAFGAWREMQQPLVLSPKHPRVYSPHKELEKMLSRWESRGIFSKPNPDQ